MATLKRVLFCVPFLIGTACESYHSKPISPHQTLASFESRRLDDPGLKRFLESNDHGEVAHWPPKSWDFETLTLVAFYYHPDLDVARAKWGMAQAGVITAGGRPNPTLSFIPEYVSNSDMASPWLFGFSFDIPIETAGKRGYRIAQAKHLSEMSRLNIATVAWQVRSRIRKNLLNLYAARQRERLLKEQFTLEEENLRLLQSRASNNSLSPLVVADIQIQLNQTLLSLRDEEKRDAEARVQVAQALGLSVTALEGIQFSFHFLDRLPKNLLSPAVQRQALLNRPDLLAVLAEYAAAESALQLEIAKQYPDIHISPGYNFDQGQNKWILGLSITPPLFNRNQGPIAEAKARRSEIATRFEALQVQILGEIDQSLAGYRASLRKLNSADSLLTAHRKKQQFVKDLTSPGEIRRVALLQSQLEFDASALSRLNAFVEAQQSLGLLEDSVQRPYEANALTPPTAETNPRNIEEKIP